MKVKISTKRIQQIKTMYPIFIKELESKKSRGLFGSNSKFEDKLVAFINRTEPSPALKEICVEAQKLGER